MHVIIARTFSLISPVLLSPLFRLFLTHHVRADRQVSLSFARSFTYQAPCLTNPSCHHWLLSNPTTAAIVQCLGPMTRSVPAFTQVKRSVPGVPLSYWHRRLASNPLSPNQA